ncbi:MAG: hypothetical protein D3924_03165 [Candidatus Electrothrix sp. AR4]|nr:hypothetical protein [Candidatus Electrothrix sp. AR4]
MAANSITFFVTSEGWPDVHDVHFGNMTDPGGTIWYYTVNTNPWTWHKAPDDSNVNPFGLLVNYYDGQSRQVRTAFHVLDVDPKIMEGDITVKAVIKPCTIAEGNIIQAYAPIEGIIGISVKPVITEAPCSIHD